MIKSHPSSGFRYRAARSDGSIESGFLEAGNIEDATSILAGRGLWPVEVTTAALGTHVVQSPRAPAQSGVLRRRTMPAAQLAVGLRVLADLLESGLPLTRSLAALEELAPAAWRESLPTIQEAVRQGRPLGSALRASPIEFPALVVGIVQSGEAGSGLPHSVRRAGEIMEEVAATHAAILGALAYPIVLGVAGTVSVALLVDVVLPRFAAILSDLGQPLPPTTQIVLNIAAFVRAAWLPGTPLLMLLVIGWHAWTRADGGRRRWHQFLLAVPLVGSVRRSAATARGCGALAALLSSGVPIAPALLHTAKATADGALGARLLAAREAVTHGEPLSRALMKTTAMTPTAVRLVRAGEESGRLAPMLDHAARLERQQAVAQMRMLVRVLEPALITLFGCVVALIASALLQALYSVRPGS